MIAKADAQTLVDNYQAKLEDRVDMFLRNRAQSGFVGGVFNYTDQDKQANAGAVKAKLEALGWVVVIDAVAKTATIS